MAGLFTPSAFERHYRIGELARIWGLGRETVRKLVKDEPGLKSAWAGKRRIRFTACPNRRRSGYIRA